MRTFIGSLALLTLSFFLSFGNVEAATIEVGCSPSQTANSCDQCFYNDQNIYQGWRQGGFFDVWNAGSQISEIYTNENPSPVRFSTNYSGTVYQFGTFNAIWQAPILMDPTYGPYLSIPENTSRTILALDTSYKVGFDTVSPAMQAAGRSAPIFGLDYVVNYWEAGFANAQEHKECIVYYGAWCGDGTIDGTKGETCDDGAQNGQPGKCNATCNGSIPAVVNGVCNPTYSGATLAGPYNWSDVSSLVCSSGTSVQGTGFPGGPWTWSCTGLNGGTSMSCSANKIATPVNGVCSSTVTGAQPSPLSNGACNVGPVIGFNASGTNPVNYTWKCGGQNGGLDSPNCTASYTLPPPLPVCSSTVIGNLPGPIFAGVCNSGSPGSFTAVGTNPVNYTWKCSNAINQFVNCSASFTPPPPLGFALSLKKYVNLDDAQPASPVPVLTNDTFNYVIKVKNNGPGPSSGESTVTDIIPLGVVFNGSPSGAGWSCTTVAFGVTCKSSAVIAAGALYPDISIPVKVTALIGTITNTAQVSNPEDVSNTPGDNSDPGVIIVSPVVLPPTCGSLSGAQLAPINGGTPNLCPLGASVVNFASGGTNPITYAWNCSNANGTSPACGATYSAVPTPSCNSIVVAPTTGVTPLNSSVICNTTNATTVSITCGNGQTFNTSSATCNYTSTGTFIPKCTVNGTVTNAACQGTVTATATPQAPFLSIKKYAGTLDGQTATGALPVVPGASFTYRYDVSNTGTVAATGVVVTDTLPQYISLGTVSAPAGWTCLTGTKTVLSIIYPTIICTTPSLAAGASISITVGATLSLATPPSSQLRNIVYVCKAGDTATPTCNPTCTDPTNPACTPPPPPPNCDPMPASPNYDPACVVPNPSAPSCGNLGSFPSGSVLSPSIDVTYTCSASGTIAIPANLEYSIKCDTGDTSTGSSYTGSNIRICRTPGTNSTTQTITCAVRDKTNTGVIFTGSNVGACNVVKTTSGGGGGGTTILYVPKCVNGSATCATTGSYPNTALCRIGEGVDCYTNQAACDIAKGTLSCGGGGCSGPSCGTCVGLGCSNGGGYCGDGVLQTGEECDVNGATWCIACKINTLTNPGANPITDLWMTIPKLSSNRLGLPLLGNSLVIPFRENSMVLGVNTRAFTIADTVGFGIKLAYQLPLIVEANKKMCLTATGASLNSNTLCTNFGDLVPSSMKFTVPGTTNEYVIIGNGDYQVRQIDGTYRQYTVTGNSNNVDLFKGSGEYINPFNGLRYKLYDAFYARQITTPPDGVLALYHNSISTGEPIDLAALRVRVSGAMVGGTSSTVNRKLETYIYSGDLISMFLSGFQGYTTTTVSTNAPGGGSSTAVSNVNLNSTNAPLGGAIIVGTGGLSSYRLNGNDDIYSIKGDVIMNCTSDITATDLQGVRTLIVENGNLIINCNNGYGSSDISSSWAFIVKNGNILVSSGVTNMAGIYVAIGTPGASACLGTGNICSIGDIATNNILRLNGSMYGNAKPLFDSRLYVRGTNAYDILTTGVVISYSNRALVNPPPLLSQYLNNYSVTRVVK